MENAAVQKLLEEMQKPIGVYTLEDGRNIYVYRIMKNNTEERIIIGDDYSGRNPRSFKLYKNTKGFYFLYRGVKVYLSGVKSLV